MSYIPVSVKEAVDISDRCKKNIVVIASYDAVFDRVHTTTYGISPKDKIVAARIGDVIHKISCENQCEKLTFEDFRTLDAAKIKARCDELEHVSEKLLESLEDAEWSGLDQNVDGNYSCCCPCCGEHEEFGHSDVCMAWQAIKMAKAAHIGTKERHDTDNHV